jgi:hypothetical protein
MSCFNLMQHATTKSNQTGSNQADSTAHRLNRPLVDEIAEQRDRHEKDRDHLTPWSRRCLVPCRCCSSTSSSDNGSVRRPSAPRPPLREGRECAAGKMGEGRRDAGARRIVLAARREDASGVERSRRSEQRRKETTRFSPTPFGSFPRASANVTTSFPT